jgi:hypothetical protein
MRSVICWCLAFYRVLHILRTHNFRHPLKLKAIVCQTCPVEGTHYSWHNIQARVCRRASVCACVCNTLVFHCYGEMYINAALSFYQYVNGHIALLVWMWGFPEGTCVDELC